MMEPAKDRYPLAGLQINFQPLMNMTQNPKGRTAIG
jgi:hypothetical protein